MWFYYKAQHGIAPLYRNHMKEIIFKHEWSSTTATKQNSTTNSNSQSVKFAEEQIQLNYKKSNWRLLMFVLFSTHILEFIAIEPTSTNQRLPVTSQKSAEYRRFNCIIFLDSDPKLVITLRWNKKKGYTAKVKSQIMHKQVQCNEHNVREAPREPRSAEIC